MNQLLPIIRRVRRPLLPVDERLPVAFAPVTEPVPVPIVLAEPPPPAPGPAPKKKGHASRPLQTAAAS